MEKRFDGRDTGPREREQRRKARRPATGRHLPWLFLTGLLAWTGLASSTMAQEKPTLEEVVVSATRTEVPAGELGVSATVIGSPEIEARRTTDVLELLRDVAGVHVVQSGSRGGLTELYLRGGESNFTLVMIDGMQVNEAGGGFDFSTLTTDNIERIEIIRGPQSALYGSDAIGGVINIITRKGQGPPTLRFSTAHGAHSENGRYMGEQKLSLSGGNEWLGYSLAYGRIDDHGILKINNDYWNNVFSGRIDVYPHEKVDMTITARMSDNRLGIPTENGGDRPDSVFPGLDPNQFQERRDVVAGLGTRVELLPWWEHCLNFGVHRLDQSFVDPPDPTYSAFDAPPGSKTKSLETRTTFDYHMNIRYPREGLVRSTFTLGYEYERESLDLTSLSTIRFGPLPWGVWISASEQDARRTNGAYYLQEQLSLFDRLHLAAGLRVEDNSSFGTDVNPRGSVAYVIKETGTKLRGAIGTGIKEPTFLENFGGFGTVGNPGLAPEESFSWEIGLDQWIWERKVRLGFTYFQNRYDNLIAYVFVPPPGISTFQNIQAAKSWGVEFDFRVRPGYGFTVGGTYTFVDTEVTDDGGLGNLFFAKGEKLLRRPNHSGSLYVDWSWRDLNVRLNGTYVGERDDTFFTVAPGPWGFYSYTNQRLVNDGYFLLNLAASYTFHLDRGLLKQVKLFAKGRNILDDSYEETMGYSSPRFGALAGVEFTF